MRWIRNIQEFSFNTPSNICFGYLQYSVCWSNQEKALLLPVILIQFGFFKVANSWGTNTVDIRKVH